MDLRYRLILWDFDGTIADTHLDVWDSLIWAAQGCSAKLPERFIADDTNLGQPVHEIFRHLVPFPGEERYETFEHDVRMHYRTLNDFSRTRLYSGMLALLNMLHCGGARNIIVTNKPQQALKRLLMVKGWAGLFDGWISPDSSVSGVRNGSKETIDSLDGKNRTDCSRKVTCGMDKITMIAWMIERFGVDRAESVSIGDTFSDVEAAHHNGIACVAVTYGDGDVESLKKHKPDYCVDNVRELFDILLERRSVSSDEEDEFTHHENSLKKNTSLIPVNLRIHGKEDRR